MEDNKLTCNVPSHVITSVPTLPVVSSHSPSSTNLSFHGRTPRSCSGMSSELCYRVKVFSFGDSNEWEDLGTGIISKDYIEVAGGEILTITVRSEADNSIIIQSKILPDRQYKLQEDMMIEWSENTTCEVALSFQEKAACDDLWKRIHEVQGHISDDTDVSDRFDEWIPDLPQCELSELEDIMNIITSVSSMPRPHQHTVALHIETDGYISKLLDLFHICEDLENGDGLHHLYHIFKALFLFNNAPLLQIMFQDDSTLMDVIGCMEYSPSKSEPTRHREYLSKISSFKKVIPFTNQEILPKIHQTYKIQYIQEVILPTPSLFEENMMSALNSIILFNKAEIVSMVQKDHAFLQELFDGLCSDATSDSKYKQLVALLRETCMFSLSLERKDRTTFFTEMNKYGFSAAIEGMLMYEDISVVSATVDILNLIVEFNSGILLEHILQTKDSTNEDGQLMNIIISLLVDGEYTEIDVQLVTLVKNLVNPDNMLLESTTEGVVQPVDKTPFLKYFYKNCIPRLLAPLMAQTSDNSISKDTSQTAILLSHILDILSLCVRIHGCYIKNYIIDKNVLSRILVLMTSSHGHLVLAALRLCRRIVELKDEFFNYYIVCMNLFSPIIKALMANGRYNLINSAILELFEYIRVENIKMLIKYTVEKFMSTLEGVDYTKTFQELKLKYEQDKFEKENKKRVTGNIVVETRYRRDPRQMEEEEEAWFDDEDDEFVPTTAALIPPPPLTTATPTTWPSFSSTPSILPSSISSNSFTLYNSYFGPVGTAPSSLTATSYSPRPATVMSRTASLSDGSKTQPVPTMSAALQSLVDYDEDSDEELSNSDESSESSESSSEAKDSDSSPSSAKRQKLT